MRVLITDFSSYKAIVIARFIKRHYPSFTVITTDHRSFTKTLRSRYSDEHIHLAASGVDAPDYPSVLAAAAATADADLIIPVNSQEIGGLLEARGLFDGRLSYWGDMETYYTLHDKALLHEKLREIGVPVPIEYARLSDATAPVVLKPTTASASKGVRYLMTQTDLDNLIESEGDVWDGHVIQSFVDGDGAGFSGYFDSGKIKAGYAHIRLGEFPVSGGSSVYRGPLPKGHQDQARSLIETVLTALPWSGFAMFEFKLTTDGRLVFIECNPRIWGSVHQGLANGVNYLEALLGAPEVAVDVPPSPRRTYMSPLIWGSLLGYLAKGKLQMLALFVKNAGNNRTDVSWLKDPLGFASVLGRIVKS